MVRGFKQVEIFTIDDIIHTSDVFYYNNQLNGDGVLHSKIKFMFFLLHKFVYNIQNNWNVRFPLYKCETNKI